MSNIIQTIQKLPQLLPLKGASEAEIAVAEKKLALHFAQEYKSYLQTFGAILADGIELTGIAKSKSRDVVSVTLQERELNPEVSQAYYVVENVGIDGIVIWQNENGEIFQTLPQTPPQKIANSLVEYVSTKS
jgi:hypothetical protein